MLGANPWSSTPLYMGQLSGDGRGTSVCFCLLKSIGSRESHCPSSAPWCSLINVLTTLPHSVDCARKSLEFSGCAGSSSDVNPERPRYCLSSSTCVGGNDAS